MAAGDPQPLFRAQDVGTTTVLKVTQPRNWKVHANKVNFGGRSNAAEAKPRYNAADYTGNAYGDGVTQAKSNIAVARSDGSAPETLPPIPRTQADKATALGTALAVDIGRRAGGIAPNQPYPDKSSAAATAPVLTSLSPNTAVAGAATPQFGIKLIGTGFTPWSEVWMAGVPAPTNIYVYISPTEIRCQMSPAASFAGAITLQVVDHGVASVTRTFTWT